ncbi:hypothetical protein GCM10020295_63140 [Streptomyces cinereospinus]
MLLGFATPSPLPSRPAQAQVDGMNCIGPTARSYVLSPSNAPSSVSLMCAKPSPFSAGPRIGVIVSPFALTLPPLAWPDSTLPMAASSSQGRLQPGVLRRSSAAACR